MNENYTKEERLAIIDYLSSFNVQERNDRLENVLYERTRYITVVLENMIQSHNASAVLRSCDCFGIQDIYTIETALKIEFSKAITKNVHKWLTLHRYWKNPKNNYSNCIANLKEKGYRIAATSPHAKDMDIFSLPVDKPVALLLGSEKEGLSRQALEDADYHVKIPMWGFSDSLNVSISAAICLNSLTNRIRTEIPEQEWRLSAEEISQLKFEWIRKSVKSATKLEEKFIQERRK